MANVVVRGLTIEYRSGPYAVRPVHEFDLDLASGELVLLLGASGCGKTSLLSVLAGILTPTAGEIHVDGQALETLSDAAMTQYRRSTVGVVFQSFNLVASLSAWENVAVPLWSAGVRGRPARARASELLESVGLGERLHHRPSELSGGQQQRVAIAAALAHDPPVILADEPTAHLDAASVEEVLSVLRALARPGRLVVIATHDHRLLPVADRVVELTASTKKSPDEPTRTVLAPGERLFREGDAGELVFFVEAGSVDLVRDLAEGGVDHVATIGPSGYFGELAPLLQLPRSASAQGGPDGATVLGLTLAKFRSQTKAGSPGSKRAPVKKTAKKTAAKKAGPARSVRSGDGRGRSR